MIVVFSLTKEFKMDIPKVILLVYPAKTLEKRGNAALRFSSIFSTFSHRELHACMGQVGMRERRDGIIFRLCLVHENFGFGYCSTFVVI